jgi:hypothetical protein
MRCKGSEVQIDRRHTAAYSRLMSLRNNDAAQRSDRMNTFDLTAEQRAQIGKFRLVECNCGWNGTQAQLALTQTKDRACPKCAAAFVRVSARMK